MDKNELFELMDRFGRSGIQRMRLEDGDFRLELEKPAPVGAVPAAAAAAPQAAPAAEAPAEPEGLCIRAPLVGTFYAAPAPGEAPFVRVGDRVAKGQTVCLIEAMKTMNEVPAPCDLLVEEILAANGALLEFNAPILRYRHV